MFLSREDKLGADAYTGDFDGIIGKDTIRAIKAFQRKRGLREDGMWGFKTNDGTDAVDADILNKGVYTDRYNNTYERANDMYALPTSFTYTKMQDMSKADVQNAVNYYLSYPELLFSDDQEHAKWRQLFHNSGKDGADLINQAMGALTQEERERIDPRKLTDSYKTDQTVSDMNATRNEFSKNLLPVLVAPVGLGAAATALTAGGAAATLAGGTLGATTGAYAGKGLGRRIGRRIGKANKDKTYSDLVAEKYGASHSIHDPKRRIREAEEVGENVGELAGSIFGGIGGGLAGSAVKAGTYNTMGLGRAVYAPKRRIPVPAEPSLNYYGSVTPPAVKGVTKPRLFWEGMKQSIGETLGLREPHYGIGSRTRAGGGYGIKIHLNGRTYNPGNTASRAAIEAGNTYFGNQYSPVNPIFGGKNNLGRGVKIGFGYEVNPVPAMELGLNPVTAVNATRHLFDDSSQEEND